MDKQEEYIFSKSDYENNLRKLGLGHLLNSSNKAKEYSTSKAFPTYPKENYDLMNDSLSKTQDSSSGNTATQQTIKQELPIKPMKNTQSFLDWLSMNKALTTIEKKDSENQNKEADQESIIRQFIQNKPKIARPNKTDLLENATEPEDSQEELDGMVTETLAELYANQHKYKEALEAYKALSLKYPEKSSYFANPIQNLTKILENQK